MDKAIKKIKRDVEVMINWGILGIDSTQDEKLIKHAYAQQAKRYHIEVEPESFQVLYKAYKDALKEAQRYKELSHEHNKSEYLEIPSTRVTFDSILQEAEEVGKSIKYDYEDLFKKEIERQRFNKLSKSMNPCMIGFIHLVERTRESIDKEAIQRFFLAEIFLDNQYKDDFLLPLTVFLESEKACTMPLVIWLWVQLVYGLYGDRAFIYQKERLGSLQECIDTEVDEEDSGEWLQCKEIEVIHYVFRSYRDLLWLYDQDGKEQKLHKWEDHFGLTAQNHIDVKIQIAANPLYFQLIGRFILKHPGLPPEIYRYLMNRYHLVDYKPGVNYSYLEPLYEAIKVVTGLTSEGIKQDVIAHANKVRQMKEEIVAIYKKTMVLSYEESQQMLVEFFQNQSYDAYFFAPEWLQSIYYYFVHKKNCSYALWECFYKLYVESDTGKGTSGAWVKKMRDYLCYDYSRYKMMYDKEKSGLCSKETIQQFYKAITAYRRCEHAREIKGKKEREEWIENNLFSDGHRDTSRASVKGWTNELLEAFAEQIDYETNRAPYGYLYVYYFEDVIIAYRGQKNEKVTLSHHAYYGYLKAYAEKYLKAFYCIPSEKRAYAQWLKQIESHLEERGK